MLLHPGVPRGAACCRPGTAPARPVIKKRSLELTGASAYIEQQQRIIAWCTEVRDERVFHAPPPFGSRWIKLRIDSTDSKVTLLFDGDHYIYRERLDTHDVAGIYMSDRRFCRGLEVEASEHIERDRAVCVIREVFRGLVMRVCLVEQPTSPYAAAFIAELRRMQCLRFR